MVPRPLRYLLLTDGSSDACLSYPIEWSLAALGWYEVEGEWVDLRGRLPPGAGLVGRLRAASESHSGDLIFIHRDAEAESPAHRMEEIAAAVATMEGLLPHVCVVPVRMTEAWLLHDELAIRKAAGKPNGKADLQIPALKRLEELGDPKAKLREALLCASEATGRLRQRKLRDFGIMRRRVAELITDYAPLRALAAFGRFEHDLHEALDAMGSTEPQPAQR